MKFLGEFKLYKDCNQSRSSKIFLRLVEWLGLGHASYSLFQCQAVKMTFFAESRNIKQIRVIWTLHDNAAYVNENTIQLHLILFPHTFLGILPLLLGDSTEVFDAEMPVDWVRFLKLNIPWYSLLKYEFFASNLIHQCRVRGPSLCK